MDSSKNVTTGGCDVKVTYIETQFVTSDAAGFKDLVQRLTGRYAAPPPAPHRPFPCRRPDDGRRSMTATGAATGPQGYHHYPVAEVRPAVTISRTPTYLDDDVIGMADFSDLFYVGGVGASERNDDGCYVSFPY